MLGKDPLVAFVATIDGARARPFCGEVLAGITWLEEADGDVLWVDES
jgi:hypothetical protein